MEKYANEEETQHKLKLVERNSDLLLRLINQLLDLAKLESGTLKVNASQGDVYSFIRAITSSFVTLAQQKQITIDVRVAGEHCHTIFDKDKLETILINLINNAIKFTPHNGFVSIKAVVNDGILNLAVADTGIGIPQEQQDQIFERFHQVSESHTEVGTGIGLALVRELVNLMAGKISLASEVDKGSEFKVTIPMENITSDQMPAADEEDDTMVIVKPETITRETPAFQPGNGMETDRPHILVVEDNPDLRTFIVESMGAEFNYHEAENGVQGLATALEETPDLIISDIMMPEMDGITMAEKLKSDIRSSHIPLILLTAKSDEETRLSGLESGANDYITKPFNKNELLLKVRNSINRQIKLQEKLRSELLSESSESSENKVESADEKFLLKVKTAIVTRMSDEQLSVESLADEIGLSRSQLFRKITALAGISVNELIRKLRLQKAAQLLKQKWGSVSQVCYEVGFSNPSYFSKIFKEEFGILPSEFDG